MKIYLQIIFVISVFVVISTKGYSANEQYIRRWYFEDWYENTSSPYNTPKSLTLTDGRIDEMLSGSLWTNNFHNSEQVGVVRLGIREKSFNYIPPGTISSFSVDLQIKYFTYGTNGLEQHSTTRTAEVDFNMVEGELVVNKAQYKINLPGAVMIQVKVLENFSTAYDFLYLESEIQVERAYDFDPEFISNDFSFVHDANDFLNISWPEIPNAEKYEMEWTFLSTANVVVNSSNQHLLEYYTISDLPIDSDPFKEGASRVQLDRNTYTFPLTLRPCVIVFRVRALGYDFDEDGTPVWTEGTWSDHACDYTQTGFLPSDMQSHAAYEITETDYHEPEKNWQVTSTFAEDGKAVQTIQYADGSSRVRQQLTMDKERSRPIVQETKYDFYGRPALSFLPAPSSHSGLTYRKFNEAESDTEITYEDFDTDATVYNPFSASDDSGAEKYYSGMNIDGPGFINSYYDNRIIDQVPYSEGYPYSRVIYTKDNTGRIKREYGPGSEFAPGSDHYIEHLYSGAGQEELNAMFGDEVGYNSHYFKHTTIDQNGQAMVEFTDMKGNVIASGLAGAAPSNMDPIGDEPATYETDALSGHNFTYPGRQSLESNYTFTLSQAQQLELSYSNNGRQITLCNDTGTEFCADCVYDLVIYLVDEDGNNYFLQEVAPDEWSNEMVIGESILTAVQNGTGYTSSCIPGLEPGLQVQDIPTVESTDGGQTYHNVTLEPGTYRIVKELRLNEEVLDYYVDRYIETSTCYNPPQIAGIDIGCGTDCSLIQTELQNAVPGSEEEAELQEIYNAYCGSSPVSVASALLNFMLVDMSPGGQYGKIRNQSDEIAPGEYPLSVYNDGNSLPVREEYLPNNSDYNPDWKHPYHVENNAEHYYSADGSIARIHLDSYDSGDPDNCVPALSGITSVIQLNGEYYVEPCELRDIEDFYANWEENWAYSLLYYHPEYPYYVMVQEQEESYMYDQELYQVDFLSLSGSTYNPLGVAPNSSGSMPADPSNIPDPIFSETNWPFTLVSISGFWDLLYEAMSHYAEDPDNPGTYFSLWQFVDIISNGNAGIGCSSTYVPVGSISESFNDEESWDKFKILYPQLKQSLLAKCYAYEAIENANAYNGCIGNENFSPLFDNYYLATADVSSGDYFIDIMPALSVFPDLHVINMCQPCNIALYELYSDKQARFPDLYNLQLNDIETPNVWELDVVNADVSWHGNLAVEQETAAEAMSNYASMMMAEFCGQCPETSALVTFIQGLLLGDEDSAYGQTESSANCNLQELYNDFGEHLNNVLTGSGSIAMTTSSSSTPQSLDVTFSRSTESCVLHLDIDNTTLYTFDDINNLCCLRQPNSAEATSGYEFAMSASVEMVPSDPDYTVPGINREITLLGTVSCMDNLFDCEFEPYCYVTGTGYELSALISFMQASGNLAGQMNVSNLTSMGLIQDNLQQSLCNAVGSTDPNEEWDWSCTEITSSELQISLSDGTSNLNFTISSAQSSDLDDIVSIIDILPPAYGSSASDNYFRLHVQMDDGQNQWDEYLDAYAPGGIYTIQCVSSYEGEDGLISFGDNENAPTGWVYSPNHDLEKIMSNLDNYYTELENSNAVISIGANNNLYVDYPADWTGVSIDHVEDYIPDPDRLSINGTSRHAIVIVQDVNGENYTLRLYSDYYDFGTYYRTADQEEYEADITALRSILDSKIAAGTLSGDMTVIYSGDNYHIVLAKEDGSYKKTVPSYDVAYEATNLYAYSNITEIDQIYITDLLYDDSGNLIALFEGRAHVNLVSMEFFSPVSGYFTPFGNTGELISWADQEVENGDFETAFVNDGSLSNDDWATLGFYSEYGNSSGSCWSGSPSVRSFSIDSDQSNGSYGSITDHTTGTSTGQFLATYYPNKEKRVIWQQQFDLSEYTDYKFSFWVDYEELITNLKYEFNLTIEFIDESGQIVSSSKYRPVNVTNDAGQITQYVPTHSGYYISENPNPGWNQLNYYFNTYENSSLTIRIRSDYYDQNGEKIAFDDISLSKKSDPECWTDDIGIQHCNEPSPLCEITLPFNTSPYPADDCQNSETTISNYLQEQANAQYLQAAREQVRRDLIDGCLNVQESLTFEQDNNFNYLTLYYYDQAGNLVKTVPPDGFEPVLENDFGQINSKRDSGETDYNTSHRKSTVYKYNSLNNPVAAYMPDHIQMSGTSGPGDTYTYSVKSYYDLLGRVLLSQNSKQRQANAYRYSYTKYDKLSRPIESGEVDLSANVESFPFYNSNAGIFDLTNSFWNQFIDDPGYVSDKREVMNTTYSESPAGFPYQQENLRNRVACVTFRQDASQNDYDVATYYSYDIHGNVKELWHHTPVMSGTDIEYIHLAYTYDLLSGNVNEVTYQEGNDDEFHHKYDYDALNRLTDVWTSRDGITWERDAEYYYYLHGPLARFELGDNKVQGEDLAYTIQGWLKAVNRDKSGMIYDIGLDGKSYSSTNRNQHSAVAEDAFGYSLSYFEGDYTATNTGFLAGVNESDFSPDLYNGNIKRMISTQKFGSGMESKLYSYQYDQLNRLVDMKSYEGNSGTYSISNSLYATSAYEYDLDGNIENLTRRSPVLDDNIGYVYPDQVSVGTEHRKIHNKLGNITNTGSIASIGSQSTGNYQYDEIGNMISDAGEEIDEIVWTPAGKVSEVIRTTSSEKEDLEFRYDAMGNRIFKISKPKSAPGVISADHSQWGSTYYSRDAQGNVMAVYTGNADANGDPANLEPAEFYLYGSSRLGSIDAEAESRDETNRSAKKFELTNHLGNVVSVITNEKKPNNFDSDQNIDYFSPVIASSVTYWPFGYPLKTENPQAYRFGFNGMEKDPEITGQEGSHYTAPFWQYDSRIARRWNVDPVDKPWESSYLAFSGNPILMIDPMGDNADGYTVDDKGYVKRVDDTGRDENGENQFDVLYNADEYEEAKEAGEINEYGNPESENKLVVNDTHILKQLSRTDKRFRNENYWTPRLVREAKDPDTGFYEKYYKIKLYQGHYSITDDKSEAKRVFEFLASNSDVEWSLNGNINNEWFISTTHLNGTAHNPTFLAGWTKYGEPIHVTLKGFEIESLVYDAHSHSGSDPEVDFKPSGNGRYGDIGNAKRARERNPNIKFWLFSPQKPGNKWTEY